MLIAATDGLWDNTYDDELLQHLPTSADDLQRVSCRVLAVVVFIGFSSCRSLCVQDLQYRREVLQNFSTTR